MSPPLPLPTTATAASPVDDPTPAPHHGRPKTFPFPASPSPSPRPEPITSPSSPNSSKQFSLLTPAALVQTAAALFDESLLLSERESIFATHYTPADHDAATPRLLPSAGVHHAPSHLNLSRGSPDAELTLPDALSTNTSITSVPSPSLIHSNGMTNTVEGFPALLVDTLHTKQGSPSKGRIHGVRRVASEGQSWAKKFHVTVPDPTVQSTTGKGQQTKAQGDMARMLPEKDNTAHEEESELDARIQRASAIKEILQQSARGERSTSRGRSHVEKSIEATLANAEPARNVRSRKSSHYMGLFKENTTPLELKKRDGKLKDKSEKPSEIEGALSYPVIEADGESIRSQSEVSPAELLDNLPHTSETLPIDQVDGPTFEPPLRNEPDLTSSYAGLKALQGSYSRPTSPLKSDHDPYFRKQDELKQMRHTKVHPLPATLLEEIRDHYNSTPLRSEILKVPEEEHPTESHEQREGSAEEAIIHDEEDEEHISSAVYFPHPGPTAEEIEHFISPDEEMRGPVSAPDVDSSLAIEQVASADSNRSFSDASAEHIDISVVSKNEKSVFHGSYQPPDEIREEILGETLPRIVENAIESSSSASESEADSGDDLGSSSQTEDAETTPTATPTLHSYLRQKKHRASVSGPKGAVILEPYSHQVGGHSTIFRFSRRAVCKQLNNRENEFYERIERSHPDMLRFLPRYIGVLNVTFSKGPKRSKATSNEIDSRSGEDIKQQPGASTQTNRGESENLHRSSITRTTSDAGSKPRIVSQSQQVGEVPQVILDQNRHIVPISLFGSPERPRSADPHHRQPNGTYTTLLSSDSPSNSGPNGAPLNQAYIRPTLPDHSTSWGTTTVNSKLREQVLREVFGPPLIHHHRRHAKGHSTLPRPRAASNRRTSNLSAQTFDQPRRNPSLPSDQWIIPELTESVDENQKGNLDSGTTAHPSLQDRLSTSTSAFDDFTNGLEKVKTSASFESDASAESSKHTIKRRHSGMGLRRRRKSLSDSGDLEYFENDDIGRLEENGVFAMEEETASASSSIYVPSTTVPRDMTNDDGTVTPNPKTSDTAAKMSKPAEGFTTPTAHLNGINHEHLPLNPKEAQLANPDQRVVYFLLLEDLTAGMGRPCVLDLKMGTRQYGIEATKKKMESQQRKCMTTTSQQLGVRICGMQTFDVKKQEPTYEDKYFGRDLKAGREFRDALVRFLYDGASYASVARHIPTILDQIGKLESMVRRLPGYRFYASSLLMLYDAEPEKSEKAIEEAGRHKAGHHRSGSDARTKKGNKWPPPIELKVVDFANCVVAEDELPAGTPCPPRHPHDVDRGYLRGLRTLKMYFLRILRDIHDQEFVERGEGEGMARGLGAGKSVDLEFSEEDEDGEVSF